MVLYPVHGDRCSDRTGIVPLCNFGCVSPAEEGRKLSGNLASGFAGYGQRLAAFGRILADRTVGALFDLRIVAAGAILLLGKLYLRFRAGNRNRKVKIPEEMRPGC